MANIGIIGAGVAGLHLGLLLQKHGVDATIYTDKTAEQIERSRVLNTVVHHHHTRERERILGVNHWDRPDRGSFCHHHSIGGEHPLSFRGDFVNPSLGVDYRLYLARLLRDFEERGGRVIVRALTSGAVDRLSAQHDLMVVSTGRAGITDLFPTEPESSPYDRPLRSLCAGYWTGISYPDPVGVTLSIAPGHGELLELPMISFDGPTTALLFECVPGGELEAIALAKYESAPKRFERLVLDAIEKRHPTIRARINEKEFAVTRPQDLLMDAVTPCVRRSYVELHTGKLAVALGDVRATIDPLTGQGGNVASYTGWTLGEMILEGGPLDRELCERLERRTSDFVLGASEWTNTMLTAPPHVISIFVAMSQNKALADEVTENFNRPDLQRDAFATPEGAAALLRRYAAVPQGSAA